MYQVYEQCWFVLHFEKPFRRRSRAQPVNLAAITVVTTCCLRNKSENLLHEGIYVYFFRNW